MKYILSGLTFLDFNHELDIGLVVAQLLFCPHCVSSFVYNSVWGLKDKE